MSLTSLSFPYQRSATPEPMRVAAIAITLAFLLAAGPILADGHNAQRLIQLILFVGLGLWMVFSGRIATAVPVARTWLPIPLSIFFLLGCISASMADSSRYALTELAILFMLLLLAARMSHEVRRAPDETLERALSALGFGCCLYLIGVMSAYVASLVLGVPMTALDFSIGFDNYRFLNHAQTVGLPLLGLFVLSAPPGSRMSKFRFVTAAGWWALLLATGGRGTLLGITAGCAVAWLTMGDAGRRFVRTMAALALSGLALYALLFVAIPVSLGMDPLGLLGNLGERSLAHPTSGRAELWLTAIEIIGKNPVFGVGPAHYAHMELTAALPAHPHNWVLQFAAEWGIPAAVLLTFVVGRGMLALARLREAIDPADMGRRIVLSAFLATAVAIVVDSLVSGVIVMPVSQLAVALFLGLSTGWMMGIAPGFSAMPTSAPLRLFAGLLILLALSAIVWGVWKELPVALGIEDEVFRKYYNPRIWHDGKFS